MKLPTSSPESWFIAEATSKSVLSAENAFWIFPVGSCSRSLVSVYADAGFEATGPDDTLVEAAGGASAIARPSRSAFSFSALRRRSSLSAAIFCLIRSLAVISSCFSFPFAAASLSCSFFFRSSLMSWVSLVLLRRISCILVLVSYARLRLFQKPASFLFLSALSCSDPPARFSASLFRISSSLAFFSSSVKGAISSVDSAKST